MTETFESTVPYGDYLYWWLKIKPNEESYALMTQSHQYDRAYLAWETVRKRRNPYFTSGTGFEGYWVGICPSAEEALARILDICHAMLASIFRLYRFQINFRSRLMKTLSGELTDRICMLEWAAQFGATLGRLRCNLLYSPPTNLFQQQTYREIMFVPPIDYQEIDHLLCQTYTLPVSFNMPCNRIDTAALNISDQEAWQIATAIGKFGHPLIRQFVRYQ